ncbi:MAG: hypothetical protein LUQ65_06720 [Candidatus Helarchaeota archaeon]|nr:hypothetical protein [Candidatus Helarchaeota archaeon]
MINTMQTAYVRVLRKIKQKADGESAVARDLAKENVEKLLSQFSEDPGILEAARKLYNIAIKSYRVPNALVAETAKDGAKLLRDKFGKSACPEIFHIFSNAITQLFDLKAEPVAQALITDAAAFFTESNCPEQATKIANVLKEPRAKSDVKLF